VPERAGETFDREGFPPVGAHLMSPLARAQYSSGSLWSGRPMFLLSIPWRTRPCSSCRADPKDKENSINERFFEEW